MRTSVDNRWPYNNFDREGYRRLPNALGKIPDVFLIRLLSTSII